jgi:hypothetical protein
MPARVAIDHSRWEFERQPTRPRRALSQAGRPSESQSGGEARQPHARKKPPVDEENGDLLPVASREIGIRVHVQDLPLPRLVREEAIHLASHFFAEVAAGTRQEL